MKSFRVLAVFAGIGLVAAQQLTAGIYKITNGANAITDPSSSFSGNTALTLTTSSDALDQYWQLVPVAGLDAGNWTLLNFGTSRNADASSLTTNAPVVSSFASINVFTHHITGNSYEIMASGTLSFGATSTGVTLQTVTSTPSTAQTWTFDLVSPLPGLYTIQNTASNTLLDTCLCSAGTAIPVVSIAASGSADQTWLVDVVQGGFSLWNLGTQAFILAPGIPVMGTTVVVDPDATQPEFTWTLTADATSGQFAITVVTLEDPGSPLFITTEANIQGAATSLGESIGASSVFTFVAA
ncbi:hypothetical protein DFH07DRAFT_816722 [Mycena maculata]|uniref:Ricin B lectin domain-containing protein n=1 Tax=Mycena maculata TaxID=230809 RepID=A0AAD7JDK9_9AGAR|nr:hypothetical protein DFH07DRAFT_816722 [Mycena maculata]